jgi:hypothetical protein
MSESRMWKEGGSEDGEGSEASVSDSIVGTTEVQPGASGEVSDIEIECSVSKVGVGPNEENESVS